MAVPLQTPANVATDYSTIAFIVRQLMDTMATAAMVKVIACTNDGGLTRVGTVDVHLLVDMVTGDGQTVPHGTIFKAPYLRIQGGANAIILDPQPDDLGVCVFAMRDISSVKGNPDAARDRTPAGAPPGSARAYSLSDAMYLGAMLNGVPTQYVQFNADGITVKSLQKITLEAPEIDLKGSIVQTGGDVSMSQNLTVQGTIHGVTDVTAATISGKDHIHTGGTIPPDGKTGAPIA